jgi:hypothetical protein
LYLFNVKITAGGKTITWFSKEKIETDGFTTTLITVGLAKSLKE